MAKFTETIKERSRMVWTKVKPYGSYLVSLLLLLVIAGTTYSLVKKDDKDTSSRPQVNVNYEPRIGEALPPDVNPDAQPNQVTQTPPAPQVSGEVATNYVSPHTGIDDDEPVAYSNDKWQFAATLPARTIVTENEDGARFASANGSAYYSVNAVKGNETVQSIAAQLKASPDVKSMTINSNNLAFTTLNYKGLVIIKGNTIYYIIGNQYLETFRTQ